MRQSTLLRDCEMTRFVIQESRGSDGALRTSALGVVQRFDTVNGNSRIYPRSFFERLLNPGSRFLSRVEERSVCGHIEHPSDGLPDLRKFAVVLTDVGFYEDMNKQYPEDMAKLVIENPENAIVGRFESLSTPDGRIVEALWIDDIQTGASSRAQGSVVKNESNAYPQYPTGIDIVQDDVDEDTLVWDIVARPSTDGAYPTRVREAIQEAIEEYRREGLLETRINEQLVPPLGEGVGGTSMSSSLSEIRARLSRVKPHMESLDRQPRRNLVSHLNEVNALLESLGSASRTLNESQELPAADMKGELQALRDTLMAHIDAALIPEAEAGRLPGATPMQVAKNTTSNYKAMNSDPALDYPSSQSFLPGGRAGAGAIQEPDAGTSDQSVPGAGVRPSGDSKLSPEQAEEERRKQDHGKVVGDAGPGGGAGVSGASIGKKGSKKESITTDQAQKTHKGVIGQEIVTQSEEGDGMEVDEFGRSFSPQPVKAGVTGSKDGSKTQGIVASQEPGDEDAIDEGGHETMSNEALANLNRELVEESRALRKECAHWRGKYERANTLVVETGSKFRKQRFKMAMERLIENNEALDETQCRSVLETAVDEKHMVQIAEALLGTRARLSQQKEQSLSIKCESDGFYRLYIDGQAHEKILDGNTMYEALLKMGISEDDVDAAFDTAHEMTYKMPDGMEGGDYEVVAMVPMEPVGEPGEEGGEMGDMGDMGELELEFGGGEEVGGDEGGDYADEMGDEEEEIEDEEVEEAHHSKMGGKTYMGKGMNGKKGKKGYMGGKKHSYMGGGGLRDEEDMTMGGSHTEGQKPGKSRFQVYAESRGLNKKKRPLNESKRKKSAPVAGARRLSESLPPAGGTPSGQPPKMGQAQAVSSQPMSLTEKVIAQKRVEKKRIDEARQAAGYVGGR